MHLFGALLVNFITVTALLCRGRDPSRNQPFRVFLTLGHVSVVRTCSAHTCKHCHGQVWKSHAKCYLHIRTYIPTKHVWLHVYGLICCYNNSKRCQCFREPIRFISTLKALSHACSFLAVSLSPQPLPASKTTCSNAQVCIGLGRKPRCLRC